MLWAAVLVVAALSDAQAQLTAQTSIAPELRECYIDPMLVNRNNLPPMTISILIDIIRKIEDNPNVNMDLRQLSALLLHTYRQDGVEFHRPETTLVSSSMVLPFAPTFHSFHRHRLLLTRLIPSNLQVLANNTVNSILKCTLHHMLSTTVDARLRGDESSCNQLSQYRALRSGRSPRSISDDVEIIDKSVLKSTGKNGQMNHFNPNDDVEFTSYDGVKSARQLLGDSQCPLLGGAVFSQWGAISAGHLIAGVAAGAQPQQVPVLELAKGSVLNYNNVQQTVTSLFPATLSGDLAEAVLIQGTDRGSSAISIGTAGNWNSTQPPRHYMLHSRTNVEMTDPEIRGDIDGFVLGSAVPSALGTFSTMRLSQYLDMFYSARNGVFNPVLRACNRRDLIQQYITSTNLASETFAFAAALDTNMPLRGTIIGGLEQLVNSAVNNFQSYTSNNLNDMSCVTTEAVSVDFRLRTNLYIVLDSMWEYNAVYPAISYLVDAIEVGKYGSSITLLNAFNGNAVVNTTFSPAEFHSNYTLAAHQNMLTGVNLLTTLTNIRVMMQARLGDESLVNYVGGNSTVVLFLLNSGPVQNNEQVFEQARLLNETVPDLRLIFATSTNQFDNLWNLVRDMHNDIRQVALSPGGINVEIAMSGIVERIQSVGRRIINPTCGSHFTGGPSGTRQFDDFVEPGYINFYSVSPNYFFTNNANSRIRIARSGAGTGSLIICHSRVVVHPRRNATIVGLEENAVICQTLASSGNVEISLQGACDPYWTIGQCPMLYLSVQSDTSGNAASSAVCTDPSVCRFPYNIRYQVQIEELLCFSGSGTIRASVIFMFAALFISIFRL
ncbi:uncharacterized protein LOC115446757 [Manduca sexta]|uniref:uncharacterized protein LOC115446757 n=1 Tax=Manduca sexta TaxID=7130 RepID=UPI0018904B0F|nr:uncharacterized protein LOC115446757 [Manduca sexta]